MYSIEIKDTTGKVVSQYECNDSLIHDDYINLDLIHQVYVSQMANKRHAIASTKIELLYIDQQENYINKRVLVLLESEAKNLL